ncbi:hypothetical protein NC653_006971 [Populus alba x Populus x berolinensis]|uniref:RNase H type-1 domain-containing protein n=1 Tax=Populus alba x Populus x berolinensis TaxID=444605 RepID=A0AAD6RFX0_9ROSI|nr:hypothetical protein NC653_006971 [Populus alba x Populus x berolinensis]
MDSLSDSEDSTGFHKFGAIIVEIKDLLSRSREISIQHTLREGNFCADYLPKLTSKREEHFQIGEIPSYGMGHLLQPDMMGISRFRFSSFFFIS